MEDLLKYASQLNKEGAACLASHNSCAAFEYFRNALQLLLLGNPCGNEILNGSPPLLGAAKSLFLRTLTYHHILCSSGGGSCMPKPLDSHLFTKPFVFQPQDDQEREEQIRIKTYIAIVLFNLATTMHRSGSSDDGDVGTEEQALHVALDLYDVGFGLLIQEESSCMDDWATNINLAILNNMSQCHYALSDFTEARRVLDLLRGLLEIIFSNRRPHNFSDQEMELFVLNTHLLLTPSAASAA